MKSLATAERRPLAAAAQPSQYLTFMLAGEAYALGILAIKEIIEHAHMTRVPMMPQFIRGVINLRGAVVPVIDLGTRFGGAPTVLGRRTCVVIVEMANARGSQDVGILVDAVNEVMDIAAADIEPPPSFGTQIRTDFIAGMGKVNDEFVLILDPVKVLSIEDLATFGTAAAAAEAGDAASAPANAF